MAAELARRACLRPGTRQRFEQAVALAGRAVLAESELGRRDALAQLLSDAEPLVRLEAMRLRLNAMRVALAEADPRLEPLRDQFGLFGLLPLSPAQVEAMRREQVAQWAEKIISSTPERHGVQLIATQTDRTPEFVKDLAYNLRARSPKLVFVQGAVNDGKPMLTVMLGDEITAQGVNAGAVVREAAKLMQGGGGGQAFFATAGGKNPDGLQAAIDKAVELIMAQLH